jgi:restriction endonuclease Mrr
VEPVTEVRNFVGALTIDNIKKGIFVTTAEKFSSVARSIPEKLNTRLELELINGDELLEILRNNTKPHESIIPPYVKSDNFWRDENGSEFDTSQIIYG